MEAEKIKLFIIENNRYIDILQHIGCHSIKDKGSYFTFGVPDGDGKNTSVLYKNSLVCNLHSRGINGDIFDLVMYCLKVNFYKCSKNICDILQIDYYEKPKEKLDVLKVLDIMNGLINNSKKEEEFVSTIPEETLSEYVRIPNQDFYNEGISPKTQNEFGVGFCLKDHLITIPIRDEIGNLVGIKARQASWIDNYEFESKYIYLHKCPKSKIVFNLDKAYEHIVNKGKCYVFESEKSVMKMWDFGVKNAVAIGGHCFSKRQVELLGRVGAVEIIICFDKDVLIEDLEKESNKFLKSSFIFDKNNLLKEKDSPIDNGLEIFKKLSSERIKNDKNFV